MTKAKKVLAAALALVMAASAVPMAFAADDSEAPLAPTAPVREGGWTSEEGQDYWNNTDGVRGYGSTFRVNKQEFTFVQTKDDEAFKFEFYADAILSWDVGDLIPYAWVFGTEERSQTFTTPVGKDMVLTWDQTIGQLQANVWKGATVSVIFTGEGAKTYDTTLDVAYAYDENWGGADQYEAHYLVPMKVTVIDARQLANWIASAEKILPNEASYEAAGWALFEQMYNAAVATLADPAITQAAVATATTNLQNAIGALKELRPDVEALNNAIAAAQAKLAEAQESGDYIQADVDALAAVINEAVELAYYADRNSKEENYAMVAELEAAVAALRFAPADYSVLDACIAEANVILSDKNLSDKYTPDSVAALKAAYDSAKAAKRDQLEKDYQETINALAATLRTAIDTLEVKTGAVTSVAIKLANNDSANSFEGNVIYHKTPFFSTWASQTVDLTIEANAGAEIASIAWVPANWSVDEPEANIENYKGTRDDQITIRPTFGIGPRSFWVKAVVTDIWGTTVESAPVKVRFINFDWQK